jgi:hypothetical protein
MLLLFVALFWLFVSSLWDLSGHESAGPLRACVKIDDCYDPFSAGILTYVKMIETCVERVFFTTERVVSAIADYLFCFGEDS